MNRLEKSDQNFVLDQPAMYLTNRQIALEKFSARGETLAPVSSGMHQSSITACPNLARLGHWQVF